MIICLVKVIASVRHVRDTRYYGERKLRSSEKLTELGFKRLLNYWEDPLEQSFKSLRGSLRGFC